MENSLESFFEQYAKYIGLHEKRPTSVTDFCDFAEASEEAFYEHFASLPALEKALWLHTFVETYLTITRDEVYENYTVREKLLSFYYTWLEFLKSYEAYIKHACQHTFPLDFHPAYWADFENSFRDYASQLLEEARVTEEFANRMVIQNAYPTILWLQAKSILRYWVKDKTENAEKTDAFIEKNVNFVCDAFSRSFLDSAFEYFRFIFQK
jgi:AcrR family transcriptional regulator